MDTKQLQHPRSDAGKRPLIRIRKRAFDSCRGHSAAVAGSAFAPGNHRDGSVKGEVIRLRGNAQAMGSESRTETMPMPVVLAFSIAIPMAWMGDYL